MVNRNIEDFIRKYANKYPVMALIGPRKCGKTTLIKYMFSTFKYVSLDNLDIRQAAQNSPCKFFKDLEPPIIIDEIQRVPHLFSYLKEISETLKPPYKYILTGSQQISLIENISELLAGRIITFNLFPYTCDELFYMQKIKKVKQIFAIKEESVKRKPVENIDRILYKGMYPEIHQKNVSVREWFEQYVMTYVETDIRRLANIQNIRLYEKFLKLLAVKSGQIMNYSSISDNLKISVPTVQKWISLLETCGIVFKLNSHYLNFSKRIVKSPKIYFLDTGLLCFLLSINNVKEMKNHPNYQYIFKTFVISELYKKIFHLCEIPPLYFWRDKRGMEIDVVVDLGGQHLPIVIKPSKTYAEDFKNNILYWSKLRGNSQKKGLVIYGGDRSIGRSFDIPIIPWWMI